MLIPVVIWMVAIFSFSAGKIVYDKCPNVPPVVSTSKLDQVYDVASLTAPIK
jgi:hypothetical protein